jgi:hypothetical protein
LGDSGSGSLLACRSVGFCVGKAVILVANILCPFNGAGMFAIGHSGGDFFWCVGWGGWGGWGGVHFILTGENYLPGTSNFGGFCN